MSPNSQYKFLRQAPRDGLSTADLPSRWQRMHIDPWLCLFLLINAMLGLTALYSASEQDVMMVSKQTMSFGIGFVVMVAIAQISPKVYQSFSPIFYILSFISLIAVMLFGEVRLGAQRWIDIPGFGSVQPSEFMKLGIGAVFGSWMSKKAITYRKLNNIPGDWGTAVNVQAMVFGNSGDDSATGVCFSRDPATGENKFYGEYLINAQGEDVVAGIRTPQPMAKDGSGRVSLEDGAFPQAPHLIRTS